MNDFPAAVVLYREQRYEEALAAFAALARAETDAGRAAVLHANAGTAAARAGEWGEAAWHLRRALQLAPRDELARGNLARVAESRGWAGDEGARFTAALRDAPLRLTPAENGAACGAALGLAALLLAARHLPRAPRWLVPAALLLALLSGGWWLAARSAWQRVERQAVVLPETAVGHAEPDERTEALFRLAAGTIVRLDDTRPGWCLVESDAGARGWLRADEVRGSRGP